MKKFYWIFLSLLIVFTACKKKSDDTSNADWSASDQAFYNNIISLQKQARTNFTTWKQTMDSVAAVNKLQQFFLSNPSVSSAIIGSQGINVQYTNGMRGGIFLNPQDGPVDSMKMRSFPKYPPIGSRLKSLVNIKKVLLIDPHYNIRKPLTDWIYANYSNLGEVGFPKKYKKYDYDADVDAFTQLSGYGIIQIYSHGWAWPDVTNLEDVYVMTGEVEHAGTAQKYAKDVKNGNIKISNGDGITEDDDVFWLSEKFIASHNDFSKDTVLFYGGFCYSFLGNWNELYTRFAKGTYFGFNWAVKAGYCTLWSVSLIDSLSDTTAGLPYTTEKWLAGLNPPKSYYNKDQKYVFITYAGDDNLTLWKAKYPVLTSPITNITQTTATGGGNIKSDGGFPVTARGVCWSTSQNPTIYDSKTTNGSGTGSFTSNLTGLTGNTSYYVRAYATNSAGTMYGNQVSFTTVKNVVYSSLYLGCGVPVHVWRYNKENILIEDYDDDGSLMFPCGPCIQNGNTLTASYDTIYELGTESATITMTLNTDHTLSFTYFLEDIENNYATTTMSCSVINLPFVVDYLNGVLEYGTDDNYPFIKSFESRVDFSDGAYTIYTLREKHGYGTTVYLYYSKMNSFISGNKSLIKLKRAKTLSEVF